MFDGLSQQKTDPLKAVVAMSMFSKLDQEAKNVTSNVLVKISDMHLSLPSNNMLFLLSLTK